MERKRGKPQCNKALLSSKNLGILTRSLKLIHDQHKFFTVGRRKRASFLSKMYMSGRKKEMRKKKKNLQNHSQFIIRDIVEMELNKAIPERPGKLLPSTIQPCGILSRKQHKVGVRLHHLLGLWDKQLPVVIKQTIEGLQDFRGSQVKFVKDNPMTISSGLNKGSFLELKFSFFVADVRTEVFLEMES